MMFGFVDLNAEIADCWKLVWKVEPAALMVPLAVDVLAEELVAAEVAAAEVLDEELEELEEHAARASAAMTAPPAAAACLLPRSCM